jgi:hypothetical protein
MRRHLATVIGILGLGLMGMGSFGGGREGPPARDFRATFVDVDGTRIDVQRVTTATEASLEGDLGRGRLRVPFDNIEHISFKPSTNERDRLLADVKLREGDSVTLTLRSSTTFYGRVPSGAYQIRARDLRSIDFGH